MNLPAALRAALSSVLLALSCLAALIAVTILVTGGWRFDVAGLRVSLTSLPRALLAFGIFAFLFTRVTPDRRAFLLTFLNRLPERSRSVAIALAVLMAAIGLGWGALIGAGADSSGYVSEAMLWRQGQLVVDQPIIGESPWPGAAATWSPLGFRPAVSKPDAIVPTYPPGLPLLMAALQTVFGFAGAFLVVPLAGGFAVFLTYVLGQRLFGQPGVSLWAAVLVATSPAFLFQLMSPMSDVPVTVAWTLALVLALGRRPFLSGLAIAAAIAIRPNLAPVALVR